MFYLHPNLDESTHLRINLVFTGDLGESLSTHSFANKFGFCERLTWSPAESLVCDVSSRLNVLHQAASCSSCYDIRDIAMHVAENSLTTHDRFRPSWGSSGRRSPLVAWKHHKREIQLGSSNWNMRRPGGAYSVAWKHHKWEIQLGSRRASRKTK
ncbi:hypothetical protein CSKR_101750 [Clonorchis sinensis]|uniref:Uncharacterized protein n=1 Tax=Clonorchis sinensis TaxID=79923 RepID=A0A3R7C840_CLOSI|nr:hypothetical protein CSKR_101750 [Clonorchis sinensis]